MASSSKYNDGFDFVGMDLNPQNETTQSYVYVCIYIYTYNIYIYMCVSMYKIYIYIYIISASNIYMIYLL